MDGIRSQNPDRGVTGRWVPKRGRISSRLVYGRTSRNGIDDRRAWARKGTVLAGGVQDRVERIESGQGQGRVIGRGED